MKKLNLLIFIIFTSFFYFTQKNVTITVTGVNDGNGEWLVYTNQNKTYEVPYDDELNINWFTNWMLLNIDAKEDWQQLHQPGTYHVRVYGLFGKPKITRILESDNEQLIVVQLFNVAILFINSLIQQ